MPNDWFNFRQFGIVQGRSAMRVCTDSCIFGALVAYEYTRFHLPPSSASFRILDIGTGTGLLSLMLAQKTESASLVALEPHVGSFLDAEQNFMKSPWARRLEVLNLRLEDYLNEPGLKPFDLIVANPPFFQSHLTSPKAERNVALHSTENLAVEWLGQLAPIFHAHTQIWFLLPGLAARQLNDAAQAAGFSLVYMHDLHQNKTKNWRSILCLSPSETQHPIFIETDLYLGQGQLHPNLTFYLSDYYL